MTRRGAPSQRNGLHKAVSSESIQRKACKDDRDANPAKNLRQEKFGGMAEDKQETNGTDNSVETTMIYTHVAQTPMLNVKSPLDRRSASASPSENCFYTPIPL